MSAKAIIISAADKVYGILAKDLFNSIQALHFDVQFDLGLLDVGLTPQQRDDFSAMGVILVAPEPDIDFPKRTEWEAEKPGLRSLLASPFLPRHFPGYQAYLWLDADVWVQTPEAITVMLVTALSTPAMCIAPELDRSYKNFFESSAMWVHYHDWYTSNFGTHIASDMMMRPMFNVGVYALRHDSPVWRAWGDLYARSLQSVGDFNTKAFMLHQLCLNLCLHRQGLPYIQMPAYYNWLTAFAIPMMNPNNGLYVDPLPPYHPISQFHLTTKNKLQECDIQILGGGSQKQNLTFSAYTHRSGLFRQKQN